ncbi:MAG: Nucleolar protein 16 [Heterodermia speciosa]|uniref:Nucleolar protein 16 n=1 Tax=Heterodermia speciosa TaxID=116794 RepID=A0A8H3I7J2_9LECA|nr:MAG: Nucleolar protein 16 [Heterodermia speciosa]
MGRMLQKKKNRSSVPRATQKPKSKHLPVKASPLVAAKWDKNLTLSQNYRRLGLTSKLNARTGGTETKAADTNHPIEDRQSKHDSLAVAASRPTTSTGLKTARVIRDQEGRILKLVDNAEGWTNPLKDPLTAMDEHIETEGALNSSNRSTHDRIGQDGVVPELEAAALAELAKITKKKRPRKQSQREQEWIERMVDRYGQDIRSMSRDRKLNPNQQTEADIRRRVEVWQKSRRQIVQIQNS